MNQSSGGDVIGLVLVLILALVGVVMFIAYVASIIWAYNDAEKRGKPGCLIALLVALASWPISLLIWLVARPEHKR